MCAGAPRNNKSTKKEVTGSMVACQDNTCNHLADQLLMDPGGASLRGNLLKLRRSMMPLDSECGRFGHKAMAGRL